MKEKPPIIDKDNLQTVEAALDAILSVSERMAKEIVSSKRGRKKSMEAELLREVPELMEIKTTVLLVKVNIGLITEEECRAAAKKLRESRDAVSKKM